MMELKLQQKHYYDRSSKELPKIQPHEIVRIRQPDNPKIWNRAIVTERATQPNSYFVNTEDGHTYRRNRRDILKTNENVFNPIYYLPEASKPPNQPNLSSHIPSSPTIEREMVTPAENTPIVDNAPLRRSTRNHSVPKKLNDYILS